MQMVLSPRIYALLNPLLIFIYLVFTYHNLMNESLLVNIKSTLHNFQIPSGPQSSVSSVVLLRAKSLQELSLCVDNIHPMKCYIRLLQM